MSENLYKAKYTKDRGKLIMNIKKVYSMDKAIQLVNMGNSILHYEENHKNKKLKVFCFMNTDKLNDDWKRLK